MKLGYTFETLNFGYVTVIAVLCKDWCVVEFSDGYQKKVHRRGIKDRKIKNPNMPSVFGVGILGDGIYKPSLNGVKTKEYAPWSYMLDRCFSSSDSRDVSYKDKSISEDWIYFQKFAAWCQGQCGFGLKGWQLDKDLLVHGNKIYSEETCVFLPRSINGALSGLTAGDNTGYYHNQKTECYSVSYWCPVKGVRGTKTFKIVDLALEFYNENKFNKLKYEYSKFRGVLDSRASDRLEAITS